MAILTSINEGVFFLGDSKQEIAVRTTGTRIYITYIVSVMEVIKFYEGKMLPVGLIQKHVDGKNYYEGMRGIDANGEMKLKRKQPLKNAPFEVLKNEKKS